MRAKVAKKTKLSKQIAELKEEPEFHENPMLKLLKITKKDKQLNKRNEFTNKLQSKVTFNLGPGVSKSALRRQKKKKKEELKPKLNDLWSSLPTTTTNLIDAIDEDIKKGSVKPKEFISSSQKAANLPNANKKTGHAKILVEEHKNFNSVLSNKQFRSSPFETLKQAISQNLQNK